MINHQLKSVPVSFYFAKLKPLLDSYKKRLNITCFSLHDRLWLYRALRPVREPALCGRALSLSIWQRSSWRKEIIYKQRFFLKCHFEVKIFLTSAFEKEINTQYQASSHSLISKWTSLERIIMSRSVSMTFGPM